MGARPKNEMRSGRPTAPGSGRPASSHHERDGGTGRAAALTCLALLAGPSGCGSAVEAPPPHEEPVEEPAAMGGTRLRPIVDVAGEAEAFRGWFDTELGAMCSDREDEDGQRRCIPGRWGVVFADPACTEPLIEQRFRQCEAREDVDFGVLWSARESSSSICDGNAEPPLAAYRATGEAPVQPTEVFRGVYTSDGDVACVDTGVAADGSTVYVPAAYLPPESFVALADTTVGDGRIRQRVRVGADGSWELRGAIDARFETACVPSAKAGGESVCAPFGAAVRASGLTASSCTEEVAITCGPRALTESTCGEMKRWFALEEEVTPHSTTTCEPVVFEDEVRVVGRELFEDDLVGVTTVASGDRIQSRASFVGGSLQISGADLLYDRELGTECSVGPDGAGTSRCFPWVNLPRPSYADPACTQPAFRANGCQVDEPPRFAAIGMEQGSCPGFEWRPLEGELAAAYELDGDACVPADTSDTFFALGAPLPVDAFATAETIIR